MSGNFLQRGEPAILDKWIRAEMAVREGIDLVIELPVVYACNSAEFFAYGSISLLEKLKIIDAICFGSEEGDIKKLARISEVLVEEPPCYQKYLKAYLSKGAAFPEARQYAISKCLNDEKASSILSSPNNILGIEYIKTLMRLNSSIKPYTFKRIQADYSSTRIQNHICSATAIRNHLINENKPLRALEEVMPKNSFKILEKSIHSGLGPISDAEFERNIFYTLRKSPAHALSEIMDVTEGLENRIKKAAYQTTSYKDMLQQIKTKRYPLTRLQRIMIHSLLGITKKNISQFQQSGGPQYARILAFSSKGADILNALKETAEIPIIISIGKHTRLEAAAQKMLDFDILATDIYSLGYPNKTFRTGRQDFYRKPYIQK